MHSTQRNGLYGKNHPTRSKFGFNQSKSLKWRRAGHGKDHSPDRSPGSDEEETSRIPTIHAVTFSNLSNCNFDDQVNLKLTVPLFVRGATIVEAAGGSFFCCDENAPLDDCKNLLFKGDAGICDCWASCFELTVLNLRVPTCAVPAVGSVIKDVMEQLSQQLYNIGPIDMVFGEITKKELPANGGNELCPAVKDVLVCRYRYSNKQALVVLNIITSKAIGLLNLISKRYQIPLRTRRGLYATLEFIVRKYDSLSERVMSMVDAYNKLQPNTSADICGTSMLLKYIKDSEGTVHDAHGSPVSITWNPEGT